ncbi:unnamed protein product [Nesidiocoris tenuis]|uniref:Uncharacterized protein n=1 Tax=Nesidiocoris tenuis TaxID=355587 RepID=A0A6H5GV04_9HEMI|nr:unnamed protein product [Nesidiocoris tenuis]
MMKFIFVQNRDAPGGARSRKAGNLAPTCSLTDLQPVHYRSSSFGTPEWEPPSVRLVPAGASRKNRPPLWAPFRCRIIPSRGTQQQQQEMQSL